MGLRSPQLLPGSLLPHVGPEQNPLSRPRPQDSARHPSLCCTCTLPSVLHVSVVSVCPGRGNPYTAVSPHLERGLVLSRVPGGHPGGGDRGVIRSGSCCVDLLCAGHRPKRCVVLTHTCVTTTL